MKDPDELAAVTLRYVEGMVPQADIAGPVRAWYSWALWKAFADGYRTAAAEKMKQHCRDSAAIRPGG